MNIFGKDKIKEAIRGASEMQSQLLLDLSEDDKRGGAIKYIEEAWTSLNLLHEQCSGKDDFSKYLPKIEKLKEDYYCMIKKHDLNIMVETDFSSSERKYPC